MNRELLKKYEEIPQPERESFAFLKELQAPLHDYFHRNADAAGGALEKGFRLSGVLDAVPETALASLRRVMADREIAECAAGFPVEFSKAQDFEHEEFSVSVSPDKAVVSAADEDGFRRGVYFLEKRIRETESRSITQGEWRRKPFIKHRISRCFFGPTNRPPYSIDELTNNVNYYPDNYLDKLAHEGINALWLTMYFRDLPSSIFPNRGKDAEKRLEKLALTVERCARYGIRIFLFFSEPKYFGKTYFSVPIEDAEAHPEVIGDRDEFGLFCLSTEAGKKYLEESVSHLFSAVPGLGGIINIMLGEDNGSCISHIVSSDPLPAGVCPVCSQRDPAEIYREYAECFTKAMHRYNPEAEFIGWFYAPGQQDGSDFIQKLLHIASRWPDNATIMFNFESGGKIRQLGKDRTVSDYSLAFIGPSELFAGATELAPRIGAKLQVGCSHEDASIPFIPVPENLYEKYRFMHGHGVSAVMQCWYFGNYPGLMNEAAGELSFEPFFPSCEAFFLHLARPDWHSDAPEVAKAWFFFSRAYRMFPANIAFEWFGPLHNSIAWPLHLFPVDEPIAPSWILKNFPQVSGDRIGECLCYMHTLDEALTLCREMSDTWEKGTAILNALRPKYAEDTARVADIALAEAVGLQMKSTVNLLSFYALREEMFYEKKNHLEEMREIVLGEIANTETMKRLCEQDSRLGYHSEAEGYLFFPVKLEARVRLLQALLEEDFPRFDPADPKMDEYTGKDPSGRKSAVLHRNSASPDCPMGGSAAWSGFYDGDKLVLTLKNLSGRKVIVDLAPCRMWPPVRIHVREDGSLWMNCGFQEPMEFTLIPMGSDLQLTIPLRIFDGFRRDGFPMQFNISGENFHWVKPEPWPSRLSYEDFNPRSTGWLYLTD